MNIHIYIHTRSQSVQQRILRIAEFNFYGKPLYDFYKIATGIIRWKQRKTWHRLPVKKKKRLPSNS